MATTLIRMMKKAASSAILLANTSPRRNYIFTTPLKNNTSIRSISTSTSYLSSQVSRAFLIPNHHHNSDLANKKSISDDTIVSLIESAIEEKFQEVLKTPKEFPFKIHEENAGYKYIKLTREYQGEEIIVSVTTPDLIFDNYVALGVSVSKKSRKTLEFDVTIHSGVIRVTFMTVKKPNDHDRGPKDFSELDENLQKALLTYLKVRGIEPSIGKFLYEVYTMRRKKYKKYERLEKLKSFFAT